MSRHRRALDDTPQMPGLSLVWALVEELAARLAEAAPGSFDRASANDLIRRLLVPAELILRRWIWILAAWLPRPAPRPDRSVSGPHADRAFRPRAADLRTPRLPAFQLTETWRRRTGARPVPPPPRTGPRGPLPPAALCREEADLRRRQLALSAAMRRPLHLARRLAARSCRPRSITPRPLVLDMPDLTIGRHVSADIRELFLRLNTAAGDAVLTLRRRRDSS